MTTILFAKQGKTWITAADSQVTTGNRAETYNRKVFRRGEYVFGFAGAVKTANTLKYADYPEYDGKMDVEEFVVAKLLPAIRKALDKGKSLDSEFGEFAEMSLLALVAGRLFHIDHSLCVTEELGGIAAVGSGGGIARLAYKITGDVKTAMKWAVSEDLYSGGTVHIKEAEAVK